MKINPEYSEDKKKPKLHHHIMLMNSYDDCIVGYIERVGSPIIACYDKQKVIDKNIKMGMTEDEAVEFFEHNQLGSYVGITTPVFLTMCTVDGIKELGE